MLAIAFIGYRCILVALFFGSFASKKNLRIEVECVLFFKIVLSYYQSFHCVAHTTNEYKGNLSRHKGTVTVSFVSDIQKCLMCCVVILFSVF